MNQELLCDRAVALLVNGQLQEAEQLFLQILAAEPENFTARHLLGVIRLQQGRNPEALEWIGAALEINPESPAALSNHGNALVALGQPEKALASYDKAVATAPDFAEAHYNRGTVLADLKRPQEALASYDRALAIAADHAQALNGRGTVLAQLKQPEEAIASYDRALAIAPDFAEALYGRGNVLSHLKRPEESLVSYDRALAIAPGFAEALYNRGTVLADLKRPQEALASYDRALAIAPNHAEALYGRGTILADLNRPEEALASYDRTLAIAPDFVAALHNRGNILLHLKRPEEALASYDRALAIQPDFVEAGNGRGSVLCEINRVEEGLAAYAHFAELAHGLSAKADPGGQEEPPHKVRHDIEQRDYLAGGKAAGAAGGGLPFHLAGGNRLATAAINPDNDRNIAEQWKTSRPQLVVIDNLLTPEALEGLRRFCRGSTIWRIIYPNGYLGATPETGFACPLLAQIADEMRAAFPAIFQAHPLRYLWAFKYDSHLNGINLHADFAAVNVNFWITPDEANLDPESGGLVVWDAGAPLDWDFEKYNNDVVAARDFLARNGAQKITVSYRANRAVIFDSDLFHETDRIKFKDGYLNRRINVTLLYGDRASEGG